MKLGWAASAKLLGRCGLGVLLLELGDTTASVEDPLLTGVERVADRARLNVDLAALGGATSSKRATTGAGDLSHKVLRVNVLTHGRYLSTGGRRVANGDSRA